MADKTLIIPHLLPQAEVNEVPDDKMTVCTDNDHTVIHQHWEWHFVSVACEQVRSICPTKAEIKPKKYFVLTAKCHYYYYYYYYSNQHYIVCSAYMESLRY
jgi:hypothetical protein